MSMYKTDIDVGDGMLPCKMSGSEDNKPPDGNSHKPASGGSMQTQKMSVTEDNKPT